MPRLAALLALLLAATAAAIAAAASAETRAARASLVLMTYNLRLDLASDGDNDWSHRRDLLAAQLRFHEPAIFGVQEALPGQLADLDQRLPEYRRVGEGREGQGRGEASAIFFLRNRFSAEDSGTFWLSPTPGQVSKGWDAAYLRVCTYARLLDHRSGQRFWVYNTHLDNEGAEARAHGIELILAHIAGHRADRLPVVLMGDMNATPDSPPIAALRAALADSRELSESAPFGPAASFNNFDYDHPASALIDYIFVSRDPGVHVRRYAVLAEPLGRHYPSDHFPVHAEVVLPPHVQRH